MPPSHDNGRVGSIAGGVDYQTNSVNRRGKRPITILQIDLESQRVHGGKRLKESFVVDQMSGEPFTSPNWVALTDPSPRHEACDG